MKEDSFHPVLPELFGFRFNVPKRGVSEHCWSCPWSLKEEGGDVLGL